MSDGFDEAVSSFKNFVEQQGWSPHLIWLRPDDALVDRRGRLFVKIPVPAENERAARSTFEDGIKRQQGVLFETLCKLPGATCCYAWTPANSIEAEYRLMPKDLKMSVRTGERGLEGRPVKSGLYWRWLKWLHRKHQSQKALLFD